MKRLAGLFIAAALAAAPSLASAQMLLTRVGKPRAATSGGGGGPGLTVDTNAYKADTTLIRVDATQLPLPRTVDSNAVRMDSTNLKMDRG